MKKLIKSMFRQFGIEIRRIPNPPSYIELVDKPRYEEQTITLLGQPFRICDGYSFYFSYREIFEQKVYGFHSVDDPPKIVDCGANYGASIVYFKSLYPNCHITAVEADPKIFEVLQWNIKKRNYDNVTLIQKAVSENISPVCFHHEGSCAGRIQSLESSKETFKVETISLDELIKEPVDFLKMDIEGSESEAICSARNLGNVPQLFVEYHSLKGSEQSLGALLEKLTTCGFRYYIHGHFCSPRPLTEEALQLGLDLQLNIFAKKSIG